MTNHNKRTSHQMVTRSFIILAKIIVPHTYCTATNNYKSRNYSLFYVSKLAKNVLNLIKKSIKN